MKKLFRETTLTVQENFLWETFVTIGSVGNPQKPIIHTYIKKNTHKSLHKI